MPPFHTLMDASEESLWSIQKIDTVTPGVSICVWCSQCWQFVVVTLCQPMSITPQPESARCPTCGLVFDWPTIEEGIHAAAALYTATGERWEWAGGIRTRNDTA